MIYENGIAKTIIGGADAISILHSGLELGSIDGHTIDTNSSDISKFDVAGGSAYAVDRSNPRNPVSVRFTWPAQEGLTTPLLASHVGTWIGVDINGTIITIPEDFTAAQLRLPYIRLGRLGHFDHTTISVFNFPLFFYDSIEWAIDTMALGTILLTGNEITANGANLSLNRSAGECHRVGANADETKGGDMNNPHSPRTSAATTIPFLRAHSDGSGKTIITGLSTLLDPDNYDNSGTLTSVTVNKWTIQVPFFFPEGTVSTLFMLYGQEVFTSFANASAAAIGNGLPTFGVDLKGGVPIARIVSKQGTTDFAASIIAGDSGIFPGNKFGVFV